MSARISLELRIQGPSGSKFSARIILPRPFSGGAAISCVLAVFADNVVLPVMVRN